MHCERYLTIKDGDISDMIVFVNFCTLFFGSNRIVFSHFRAENPNTVVSDGGAAYHCASCALLTDKSCIS